MQSGLRKSLHRILFESKEKAECLMLFAYLSGAACTLFTSRDKHILPTNEHDLKRLVFCCYFLHVNCIYYSLQVKAANDNAANALAHCQAFELAGAVFRSIGDLIVAVMSAEQDAQIRKHQALTHLRTIGVLTIESLNSTDSEIPSLQRITSMQYHPGDMWFNLLDCRSGLEHQLLMQALINDLSLGLYLTYF